MTLRDAFHDLSRALRIEPVDATTFAADVPDGWQQGRGAFGGLVLALLARAMETVNADPARPLRALSGELVAPVLPGATMLRVRIIRQGTGLTCLVAELEQAGEVRALATGTFARVRAGDRDAVYLEPPSVPAWRDVPVAPIDPPLGPAFARAFELRPVHGLPFSANPEAATSGWVRSRWPLAEIGAAEVVAYADTWWPVALTMESAPRAMATIAFSLQVCTDLASLDPSEPLLHRSRGLAVHAGYAVELRELWTAGGRLVTTNPQTFAILG